MYHSVEDVNLAKTIVERVTDDCKVIVEGETQFLDLMSNGLVEAKNILIGSDLCKKINDKN